MEQRALLAIALSIIVLIGYQYFFVKPQIESQQAQMAEEAVIKPDRINEQQQGIVAEEKKKNYADPPVVGTQPSSLSVIPSGEEKIIKVETPLYTASISTLGATIRTFTLKQYLEKDGAPVSILKDQVTVPPLSVGDTRDFTFSGKIFETSDKDVSLQGDSTKRLAFYLESGDVRIKRTYTFSGNSYAIELKDDVNGLNEYYITLGSDFGVTDAQAYAAHIGPVLLQGIDRMEFDREDKMDTIKRYTEEIKWTAIEDMYFFSSLIPKESVNEALVWDIKGKTIIAYRTNRNVNEFTLFAGPKKEEILKPLNKELEHIIDFGFFSIVARPIFRLLKFLNGFLGNYGWSIVFLTVIVRVPFIPLMNKGQSSMKKFQKIQPMMNEIRERHKNNTQQMQKEMMDLYKKHKVNPMGGCLPILIQLPVFIALYKVLLVAIELRDAPFIFWIQDLSSKDPLYILPLVMGGTMFLQQKMTPTSLDPRQAKIMLIMPIVFTFMFLNFSSGLVLYWLINNIIGIIQQFYVNKKVSVD